MKYGIASALAVVMLAGLVDGRRGSIDSAGEDRGTGPAALLVDAKGMTLDVERQGRSGEIVVHRRLRCRLAAPDRNCRG